MRTNEKKKTSKKRAMALHYAEMDWPVLPLHGIVKGNCTCGKDDCSSPGKHPRLANGFKGATTDEKQIKKWWQDWSNANVGIRTGIESGIVVLDIDPRNGGDESLDGLIKKHGPLPETVCVNTGGGGQHYYFKHPGGSIKGRHNFSGKGIDLKANGGYVVAPPSLHASKKRYKWADGASPDDIELAEMPDWILEQKAEKRSRLSQQSEIAVEGERNTKLTSIAGSLRRNGMSEETMLPVLMAANESNCDPSLPESEVQTIVASVGSYPAEPVEDKESQATAMVRLAEQSILFHDPDKNSFAVIEVDGHKECWPLGSTNFETWLRGQYYRASGKAVGPQAFQSAVGVLRCQASFEGKEKNIHVRVAGKKSKIWIDLGDPEWRSVAITRNGWKILKNHPVRFIRSKTTRALPWPVRGGTLDELQDFINLKSSDDWILLASWLVGALQPNGPYPLLVVTGEQGSSKSTFCRVLRSLIDPQEPDLRSQPKDERDLMISASRSWILAYDNLSKITPGMSDALCRLSTGGGFATRQMYSDNEEYVFNFKRPLILNGISELANRSDLLDRSINLTLPPIPSSERLPESEYWKNFNKLRPRIFGALLDIVSSVLNRIDKVKLDELPRMADFARWATAAEPALGFEKGSFLRAYQSKQEMYNHDVIESSAIASSSVRVYPPNLLPAMFVLKIEL